MGLYVYSCLPLHMVKNDIPLLNLGIFASLALFTRTLVPIFLASVLALEKLVLPTFALALVVGIGNCILPDVPAMLYLNIYVLMLLPTRCGFQAAAVKVWPSQRVKALRLYEGFYTLGYCMSSLWGASMYTIGGWKLCIWCQVGILSVALILAFSVPVLRPAKKISLEAATTSPAVQSEMQNSAHNTRQPDSKGVKSKVERDSWWYLSIFIGIGSGVALFSYASEWAIYLIYLTERFDMRVLPIGLGQMGGDIGGATILMMSMVTGKGVSCTSANKRAVACGARCCSLPWSMLWLGAFFALTFVLFLSKFMPLAITGQVVMGTMYVLLQQGFSELIEWCSRAGARENSSATTQEARYQIYAANADACFSCGCGLGSILPFFVLEQLSAEWVCYIATGLIAIYTVTFGIVFLYVVGMKGLNQASDHDHAMEPAPEAKREMGSTSEGVHAQQLQGQDVTICSI